MTKKMGILFILASLVFALLFAGKAGMTFAERTAEKYGLSMDDLDLRYARSSGATVDPLAYMLKSMRTQAAKEQEKAFYFFLALFSFSLGAVLVGIGANGERQRDLLLMLADRLQENKAPESESSGPSEGKNET